MTGATIKQTSDKNDLWMIFLSPADVSITFFSKQNKKRYCSNQ
ncbi:hypothetical protein RV15_GL002661 [Enterococcus silesiacus]|uniref:Uncharacterized protein n=1 Tax=Enterococcus silesiacus TaxID=332949 RepID=A0AA91GM61_9ENTE|nr:hypothetical protein RV15_GL002661 [Enterococcus silesiacus]